MAILEAGLNFLDNLPNDTGRQRNSLSSNVGRSGFNGRLAAETRQSY